LAPRGTIWRTIARLVVGLFLLRAIVPTGFMPDLAALHDGRIEITLCTIEGLKTVAVDLADRTDGKNPSDKEIASHSLCPFGSVTAQSLALPTASALSVNSDPVSLDVVSASFAFLLSPTQGPPLGSRAPPSTFAI